VGLDIVNFVWWMVLPRRHAHLGDSVLLRQRWRTAVNARGGDDNFAVMCAGIYPACTLARMVRLWLFPIPNSNSICRSFARR